MTELGRNWERKKLPDGRTQLTLYQSPIAYQRGGVWTRITNALGASGDLAFPIGVDELVQFRIKDKLAGQAPVLHFGKGQTHVRITPLDTNNVNGVVDGQSITFPEAWNNADLRLTIAGHRLQKDVVLKAGHPQQFQFRIDEHIGLNLDTLETADFRISQPVLRDPSGPEFDDTLAWVVTQQGGKTILIVTLPPGDHAGKVLDPTLTLQPAEAQGLDCCFFNNDTDRHDGAGGLYASEYASQRWRSLIAFSGLDVIPSSASISSAILTLTRWNEASVIDVNIGAHRALTQWYDARANVNPPGGGVDASVWLYRNYNGSVAWAGGAGGGSGSDWATTATDTQPWTTPSGTMAFNVKTDVAAWVAGEATNYGWWILNLSTAEECWKQFRSSSDLTTAYRPKLVIEYSHPTEERSQTIKVAQARSDLQSYLTEARSQTLLITQAKSDVRTYLIEQRDQALLIAQARTDRKKYAKYVTQAILITQARSDLQGYLDQPSQVIKIVQSLYWHGFAIAALRYIRGDGLITSLSTGKYRWIEEDGFGMANERIVSRTAPYQHGASYVRSTTGPRWLTVGIRIHGDDYADLLDTRAALIDALSARYGMGKLWRRVSSGELREIEALIVKGPKMPHKGPGVSMLVDILRFWCPNPYFYEPVLQSATYDFAAPGDQTVYPVAGSAPSAPSWELHGPFTEATVENKTTGEKFVLEYTVEDGETVEVKAAFGQKSVVLLPSTDVLGYLTTDSVLWYLEPGTNEVYLKLVGASDSSMVLKYYKRYTGV